MCCDGHPPPHGYQPPSGKLKPTRTEQGMNTFGSGAFEGGTSRQTSRQGTALTEMMVKNAARFGTECVSGLSAFPPNPELPFDKYHRVGWHVCQKVDHLPSPLQSRQRQEKEHRN
jgi:hypothetical protein